jgi:hypothetical protein
MTGLGPRKQPTGSFSRQKNSEKLSWSNEKREDGVGVYGVGWGIKSNYEHGV